MAGGKESPRQKMINMMYLVLTAMLAMNVSSEILNAFKVVNASIDKSNSIIDSKNKDVIEAFKTAMEDPQTRAKAAIWNPTANEIVKTSNDMISKIDQLKLFLKKESNLKTDDKGVETFKEDDLDVCSRVLVEKGEGLKLYNEINELKTKLMNIYKNTPGLDAAASQQAAKDMEAFSRNIPLNLEVPKSTTGQTYSQDGKGWATATFSGTPTIAGLTILNKLQNDVRNTEAQLLDYCLGNLGKVKIVYDKFAAIATVSTTYCMPGDPVEVSAGVGAFNDQAKPRIYINGALVPLGADGMSVWKTTAAAGSGDRTIPVKIEFVTPSGETKVENRTLKYTVGTPSGAALMLDKMNVFYIGLDNPITVSSGTGHEKTKLIPSGGGITLSNTGPGKYVVRATSVGNATISVVADNKKSDFQFRVKRVPDPVFTIGGTITTQKVQKGVLAGQQGFVAKLDNFDFEAKYTVESYDFVYIPKGDDLKSGSGTGAYFNPTLSNYIKNCKSKDVFTFENVKVKGPDGSVRKIPGLAVTII
ncbi:MAG: gliding motility protein GldM [Chitinophagales bacterium]|jgi:gliding motility-associated protein GldM|nr:gliding motility protein GldM [Chitinophagales bacterium]